MSRLREFFAPYWQSIQTTLFPWLQEELGPLTEKQLQLVQTLEIIRVEQHIPQHFSVPGRPPKDRAAIARAFVAKAVYNMPTTRALLDRLSSDVGLRRLCGWESKREVPSESVFSRAFAEFATTQLTQRVHEALIRETHEDRLVGHISRDSTAIEAREKPVQKEKLAERTTNLYDVMDSAYDAEELKQYSRKLGHVPLIDINTRSNKARKEELEAEARRLKVIGFQLPEEVRYNERTAIERVNARFKDEFGGRYVRVRGATKVMCHCMFGILALTADQLMRLIT